MSFSWSHTFTDADAMFDTAFVNRICHALRQRGLDSSAGKDFSDVADGDNAQDYSFWRAMQFDPSFVVGGGGPWFGMPSNWVDAKDWSGFDIAPYTLDLLPLSDWNYMKAVKLGGNGYTRKFPREIDNASSTTYTYDLEFYDLATSTTYTDGSAFVNGDYARLLDDYGGGDVYQRVAGAWSGPVVHAADKGRFADGHKALNRAEGLCYTRASGSWFVMGGRWDVISAFGPIRLGDYIGPWIINEIVACINTLSAYVQLVLYPSQNISDGTSNHYSGSGTDTTYAAALSAAQASFGPVGSVNHDQIFAYGQSQDDTALDGTFTVFLERQRMKASITDASDGLASEYDFYVAASPVADGFNANSDPVLESDPFIPTSIINRFDTQAGSGAGGNIKSAFCGGTTAPAATAPPTNGSAQIGYASGGFLFVRRLNVAGGYSEGPGLT